MVCFAWCWLEHMSVDAAYEFGTLVVPGADQMRRDQVGGDTVLRVSATIRVNQPRSIDQH
jgi:hypothetical protein